MRYRILGRDEAVVEDGEASASVADGVLTVVPATGEPLRMRLSEVADVLDVDSPGRLTLVLRDGSTVQLTMLGRLQGRLAAEVLQHRGAAVAKAQFLDGVGRPETFPGAVDDVDAELRLYDDALVVLPRSGPAAKVPFSLVHEVRTDATGYRIEVLGLDDRPLVLHRLARRTQEFVTLLNKRVADARVRTSALVGALLPGLDPMALRQVSALLRDGVAAPREALDAVDDTVLEALLRACTLPERTSCVVSLLGLGDVAFGLHQVRTVERAGTASGGVAGSSAPVAPVASGPRDHGGMPPAPGGLGGVLQGAVTAALGEPGLLGGPGPGYGAPGPGGYGGEFGGHGPGGHGGFGDPLGGALTTALWMGGFGRGGLGGGVGSVARGGHHRGGSLGHQHSAVPRAQPKQGRSLPAWTDLRALRVGGPDATVVAFVLVTTPSGHVVHEVVSEADHATYVYGPGTAGQGSPTPGPGLTGVNLALAQLGFRVEPILADGVAADSPVRRALEQLPSLRLLRESFVGRVVHGEGWQQRLEALLT